MKLKKEREQLVNAAGNLKPRTVLVQAVKQAMVEAKKEGKLDSNKSKVDAVAMNLNEPEVVLDKSSNQPERAHNSSNSRRRRSRDSTKRKEQLVGQCMAKSKTCNPPGKPGGRIQQTNRRKAKVVVRKKEQPIKRRGKAKEKGEPGKGHGKKAKANAKMNHREAVRINAFWRLLDGCCHADLAWRFDRHDELCQKLYMVDAGMVRRPEVSELPWAVLLTFGPLSKTHFLWQASSSLQAVLAGNKQLWQHAALETCIGRIFKA